MLRKGRERWLRVHRRLERGGMPRDTGAAAIEFATIGVLLLLPVVYLVITLGRIQAGSLAAQAGARSAARAMTISDSDDQGAAQAQVAADVALSDQGFDTEDSTLEMTCSRGPCLTPGAEVAMHLDVRVGLPLVPSFLSGVVPLSVTVTASHLAVVDEFRQAGT